MNTDLAAPVAACSFIIAALAATGIAAEILAHRAKARKAKTASEPGLDRDDCYALRALVEGLDETVQRHLAAIRAGGRDDDAIALLGLLDRAGLSAGRLGALTAALAQAARTARTEPGHGANAADAAETSDRAATRPGEDTNA